MTVSSEQKAVSSKNSHTYDEDLAKAVYGRLPRYLPLLQALADKLAL